MRVLDRPRWALERLECQQICFIMAPKTGSKKPMETWRPERDLDKVGRTEKKHILRLTLMMGCKSACKTSADRSKILRWLIPLLGPNLIRKRGPTKDLKAGMKM